MARRKYYKIKKIGKQRLSISDDDDVQHVIFVKSGLNVAVIVSEINDNYDNLPQLDLEGVGTLIKWLKVQEKEMKESR